MHWMTWVLFVGLLWICILAREKEPWYKRGKWTLKDCLTMDHVHFLVRDNFNGFINPTAYFNQVDGCIVFLKKNTTNQGKLNKWWPQLEETEHGFLLQISKWQKNRKLHLCILNGTQCNATVSKSTGLETVQDINTGPCQVRCVSTETICQQGTYHEAYCTETAPEVNNKYMINITATNKSCINCDNPVKKPEEHIEPAQALEALGATSSFEEGEEVDAAQAAEVMSKLGNLATSMNGSSLAVTLAEGVEGVLVKETESNEVEEISFGYSDPNKGLNIIENRDIVNGFSRSVTVPKEAFQKSFGPNVTAAFAAVFRFLNLTKDENNSTVLGNEVLAIEMGTTISNLTDKININFRNMKYEGYPSCHSWNGQGGRPNWTGDGCLTIQNGDNITCQCSHLTFFAILLAPPNVTISSSDLNTLTTLTQVGCGLSMFFLSIVIFMHFLLRRTKASLATRILIHLVLAMFLLNLTFLINNFVAQMKNSVGCKIMAATMHYFMLATFTWFAVQAFHLCLQLYHRGKILIRHYMLKVSITSWVLPSVVGIVLLIVGKYGEQTIHTDDTQESISMCWITDSDTHYIVNIGYYALVFLFTFTTFIIIVSWLFCLKRANTGNRQINRNGKSIVTILGLCCMLGITWGFAFFAHGVLRIPAYYIFTVLNSFQGFFLFIYYYNTSHSGEVNSGENLTSSSSSTATLKTSVDSFNNPYNNPQGKR